MPNRDVFHCEDGKPSFEDFSNANGMVYWCASDLADFLEYEDFEVFKKNVINKAIGVCMTLGFNVMENFVQFSHEKGGKIINDFKLSRFACFLSAVNGNPTHQQVARAQAYFVTYAEAAERLMAEQEIADRLIIRDEVTKGNRSLQGVAKKAGVVDFGLFNNAGYMGMYNMGFSKLQQYKGVPEGRSPLDFMGQAELAANLFRLTQTGERIKRRGDRGQSALEQTAMTVGREVRELVMKDNGMAPEHLPSATDITEVKKTLKKTHTQLKKADKPKSSKKPGKDDPAK